MLFIKKHCTFLMAVYSLKQNSGDVDLHITACCNVYRDICFLHLNC